MQLLQTYRVSDCGQSILSAVCHQDRFFVSDAHTNSIKVFNKEGKFFYNIGSEGSGDGQLKHPIGLAIDKFNNLIVCVAGNGRLQIFRLDGMFVSKINCAGAPYYIAVSRNGKLFVTELTERCSVFVFQ